ncbi:MAG: SEC-C metal-binding domain-containing protein [Desulfobacteraceae bacterium]|jgi:hypothetical protein
MKKIGRNDPCPCGSGKKFKKCHMGRGDQFGLNGLGEIPIEEVGARIANLPPVNYGRSQAMVDALDMKELTGSDMGIKFVDLDGYAELNLFGSGQRSAGTGRKGGILINMHKTIKADPDHLYLAISPDIDDATLIHQLAHVLDFLGGSKLLPGTLEVLAYELGIPVEHLEHPEEFGHWLEYLKKRFDVTLDADDAIISYLYQNGLLLRGREIQGKNGLILKSKSDHILRFLSEHSGEVDALIRNRPGYIGARSAKG